jgi:hypothetical protein
VTPPAGCWDSILIILQRTTPPPMRQFVSSSHGFPLALLHCPKIISGSSRKFAERGLLGYGHPIGPPTPLLNTPLFKTRAGHVPLVLSCGRGHPAHGLCYCQTQSQLLGILGGFSAGITALSLAASGRFVSSDCRFGAGDLCSFCSLDILVRCIEFPFGSDMEIPTWGLDCFRTPVAP